MSKVPVDEARMILETFEREGRKDKLLEVRLAQAWSALGFLEAQEENNMLLQAQNEILTRIANYLKLIVAMQAAENGWEMPK